MLTIHAVGKTDPGRKRQNNEDNFLVLPERCLFAVADGMGGHAAGEVASRMVVDSLAEAAATGCADPEGTGPSAADPAAVITEALLRANQDIFDQGNRNAAQRGMGSTTTVLHLDPRGRYTIGQVGDSRAYLCRGGVVAQLTVDHSLVQEQRELGLLQEGDVPGHRLKNIITRSVGARAEVKVDIYQEECRGGDIFLLCSDGFSNEMTPAEIGSLLGEPGSLEERAERCIARGNEKDGSDNLTVVLVEAREAAVSAAAGGGGEGVGDRTMTAPPAGLDSTVIGRPIPEGVVPPGEREAGGITAAAAATPASAAATVPASAAATLPGAAASAGESVEADGKGTADPAAATAPAARHAVRRRRKAWLWILLLLLFLALLGGAALAALFFLGFLD